MSHIFDALQRSEAEQSGEAPALAVATELIQAVERKATTDREPVVERGFPVEPEIGSEIGTLGPNPTAVDQFPSLQVAVNPQSRLVSLADHESLAAEKFRFLGVRLRQLRQNRPLKKILITSSIPQEGKSMVAANLACTLAETAAKDSAAGW